MGYKVEVFNEEGRFVGYGWRGKVSVHPRWYHHPSGARKCVESLERNTPEYHCFINKFSLPSPKFASIMKT